MKIIPDRFQDLTGAQYGRLIALEFVGVKNKKTYWLWRCECGVVKELPPGDIKNGRTKSCGCLGRETSTARGHSSATHGHTVGTRSSMYRTWSSMRNRCNNPRHPAYPHYGARGIAVCARWNNFEYFLADMGDRPTGLSLDRIDNDQGYSSENCRWATKAQQSQNQRSTRLSPEIAEAIRKDPRTQREIAANYEIHQAHVSLIQRNKIWKPT